MSGREERVARVAAALRAAGLAAEIRRLEQNTATAPQAAAALGCQVAQIAKTLVFRRLADDAPVVAILSGASRVSPEKLAKAAGGKVRKGDAAFVKEKCGFEIGGMAPVGFPPGGAIVMDSGLRKFQTVWAAAGSAYAVFPAAPDDLARAAGATVADIAEQAERERR